MTRRASRIGFDWDSAEGVLEKVAEEATELRNEIADGGAERIEEEAGDLLFAAVNVARFLHVDPEIARPGAPALIRLGAVEMAGPEPPMFWFRDPDGNTLLIVELG